MGRNEESQYPEPNPAVREDLAATQFGELYVAQRDPGFHIESHHGFSSRASTKTEVNGGAVGTSGGLIKLSTQTNADDKVVLDTNQAGEYGSGKEAEAKIAIALTGRPTKDAVIRWGYFNDDNGLFFQDSADGIEYFRRDAGTDIKLTDASQVDQSSLLVGKADAEVVPGDLNLDDLHIWGFSPWAWYAAGGEVTGAVEKPREVKLRQRKPHQQILFKYFPQYDDQLSGTFMQTPNLPIRVELINDPSSSTSPDSGLEVLVGGRQFSLVGQQRVARTPFHETASVTVGTTREPIFAIRPRDTFDGTDTPTRENSVNLRVLQALAGSAGNITIDAEINAEVDEPYSLPGSLSEGDTSVEVAYTTDGTLTESTGGGGQPAGIGALVRGGNSQASADKGAARESDALGNGQSLVFYAQAKSSAVDIDLIVPWTESQQGS